MSGTLEHLDPTTLLIGENVRDKAGLEPQFVASIGEHGVLQPVTAVRTDDRRGSPRRAAPHAGRPRSRTVQHPGVCARRGADEHQVGYRANGSPSRSSPTTTARH